MTGIEHKRNHVKKLEEGNERSYAELLAEVSKHGGKWGMDTSDLRREMFFDMMVEWGIISEEQKLDFDLRFHEKIDEALVQAWADFRDQLAAAKKRPLAVVKAPQGLVDGHGRPLS